MGINTFKNSQKFKKDSNNCTKNSKNKIDNSQATKRCKTNNVLPNSANLSLLIEESENNLTLIIKVAVAKGNDIIEPESNIDNQPVATNSNLNVTNNLLRYIPEIKIQDPAPHSHLALTASKNPVKNSVKNSNNKLKYTNPNISKKNLKNQRSSHLDTDDDDSSDDRCWTLEILVYKPLIRLPKKIKVKIILYSKTKTRKLKLNSNRRSDVTASLWKTNDGELFLLRGAASLGSLNAQIMMNLRLFRCERLALWFPGISLDVDFMVGSLTL
ncbi:unnamed protein product [Rhizophagus irregularis]|nr:unnamed protein product [Rhizophagus irregularis]